MVEGLGSSNKYFITFLFAGPLARQHESQHLGSRTPDGLHPRDGPKGAESQGFEGLLVSFGFMDGALD
jgi:hypothetical protein